MTRMPLIEAIEARNAERIARLLAEGEDPDARDARGCPVLLYAVWTGDAALVRPFLEVGADPEAGWNISETNRAAGRGASDGVLGDVISTPATDCNSGEIARLLVAHGVDPMAFEDDMFPHATGAALIPPRHVTPDSFTRQARPRPGAANPERFEPDFWIEQIRTGRSGYAGEIEVMGHRAEVCGPAVWSFDRFGRTATRLSDGRLVLIAGEHEDHYDPDFHIYADVTVLDGAGGVEHYIYPPDVFPPTDFHSATLVGDHIWIVGSLGYPDGRRFGETQVLRLDTRDFAVERIETGGDAPGWIHRHEAIPEDGAILVAGGKVEPDYRDLEGIWRLDLGTGVWSRAD